jgi:hypothetical protein
MKLPNGCAMCCGTLSEGIKSGRYGRRSGESSAPRETLLRSPGAGVIEPVTTGSRNVSLATDTGAGFFRLIRAAEPRKDPSRTVTTTARLTIVRRCARRYLRETARKDAARGVAEPRTARSRSASPRLGLDDEPSNVGMFHLGALPEELPIRIDDLHAARRRLIVIISPCRSSACSPHSDRPTGRPTGDARITHGGQRTTNACLRPADEIRVTPENITVRYEDCTGGRSCTDPSESSLDAIHFVPS